MNEVDNNFIFDTNENDFAKNVIENSDKKLILVDFWAPWCGPCKQLSPLLDEVVTASNGKVLLAKVNIDENQNIAAQLKIQSIPTVIAFKDKQILDGFQGVIPKNKIIEFIEKNLGEKINKDNSEFFYKINELIKKQEFESAKNLLEEFLAENSADVEGISYYINCLIELKLYQEAKDFLSGLSDDIKKDKKIQSSIANLEIKEQNIGGPSIEELEKKYNLNDMDLDNLLNLSDKYFVINETNKAFDLLINNFLKFKEREREKIKKNLIKFFEALGNDNEFTKKYRKKLSSLLFS